MSFSSFFKVITVALFIAISLPLTSSAMHSKALPTDSIADAKIIATITSRVYQIQAMDKTNLTSAEKRALKKELKGLKAQATAVERSRGVYLSIGAIIIIILLLILLL